MFILSMSEHLGTICIAFLDCVVVVDAFVVVVEAVGGEWILNSTSSHLK